MDFIDAYNELLLYFKITCLEHYGKLGNIYEFIYCYFLGVCWGRGDPLGINSLIREWRWFEKIEVN